MKIIAFLWLLSLQCMGVVFPIIGFSGETGTMLGLFWQKELSKSSYLQAFGITQKKGQSGFISASNIPWQNRLLSIELFGANTGKNYYGIGNTRKKTNVQTLVFNELNASISVSQFVTTKWRLVTGINAQHYSEDPHKNTRQTFKSINMLGVIIGAKLDTRNTSINPTHGYFNEALINLYDGQTILSNDVRYYKPIKHGILATKVFSTQTLTNHPHIQFLSGAGNYNYLRGYTSNDALDKHLSFWQIEWRASITSWLTAVPFAEIGVSGTHPGNLERTLFSYGIAGHIPMGGSSLRIELATAEKNQEFYFGFNHVF